MSLTLKVLSFKNQPITDMAIVSIDNNGGTIGRSNDNTLVLPDTEKFVSRHHANIKMERGEYFLTDTSLGGIYINGQETPLHNATVRLDNNTVLKVGEYDIAVTIVNEQIDDSFPFLTPASAPASPFISADEPWQETEALNLNRLMNDDFASHEELIQPKNKTAPDFVSGLQGNNSPMFDSYIAPSIIPPTPVTEIPENLSFNDLFADHDLKPAYQPPAAHHKTVSDNSPLQNIAANPTFEEIPENLSFEDLFAEPEVKQTSNFSEFEPTYETAAIEIPTPPIASPNKAEKLEDLFAEPEVKQKSNFPEFEPIHKPAAIEIPPPPIVSQKAEEELETVSSHPKSSPSAFEKPTISLAPQPLASHVLFEAFLQGAAVNCAEMTPAQQIEAFQRIGKMFRKLVDGTVSVLRSRAEFKSMCRVSMTVIQARDNNPLKFTVSTDDVLQQLIENEKDGFLSSVDAIEEGFNDIMNHQLAMQAGIQASLADLLKTFAPEIIEKQFEQGIVLQKKAKCWDRYAEVYRDTVDEAQENFFGDEFVKAYEKQLRLLTNKRN